MLVNYQVTCLTEQVSMDCRLQQFEVAMVVVAQGVGRHAVRKFVSRELWLLGLHFISRHRFWERLMSPKRGVGGQRGLPVGTCDALALSGVSFSF